MIDGLEDRGFGDRVEHDPLHGFRPEDFFRLQHFEDVPGNRLALAVGVGGQNDPARALHRLGYFRQPFGRFGIDIP